MHDPMVIIKDEPQDDDFYEPQDDVFFVPDSNTVSESRIKQELQDDENLLIPDAQTLPDLLSNANALQGTSASGGDNQISSRAGHQQSQQHPQPDSTRARARAPDGQALNSQCFLKPYLNRPQFHRLRCGHDIATVTAQACGTNCQPPTRYTGSDTKPTDNKFECPHPDCKRQANVVPRINPKTKQRVYGRECQLAHVRGRDLQADQAWDAEKEILEKRSRLRARPGNQEYARKTSRSPPPKRYPMQPPTSRMRRGSTILTAEEIGKQMDGPERKLFAAQKGKHTRKLRGDRPETQLDRNMDATERNFSGLRGLGGIPLQRRPPKRGRINRTSANPMPAFREDNDPDEYEKEEDDDEGTEEQDGFQEEDDERGCICRSSNQQVMVECQYDDCSKTFHLGCVGKGKFSQAQYELPNADEFHKEDAEEWYNGVRKDFECPECEAKNSEKRADPDFFKLHDLQLQFTMKLMTHKKAALGRATDDEQKTSVEVFFDKIEQEMKTCASVELKVWRSLLAKVWVSSAPLPTPSLRKRGAEEVDAEEMGPGVDGSASSKSRKVTGEATRPLSKTASNDRAEQSSRPSASQVYREGGEMTLVIGKPKRERVRVRGRKRFE